jgi:flagellar biogenesis protein FliO
MDNRWREVMLAIANRLRSLPVWAWAVAALVGLGALAFLWDSGQPAAIADPFAPPDWSIFFSVFLKLGVVLALIYVGLFLLKKWRVDGVGENRRRLALLETLRLSPKQAVHLVRADGRVFMVGATDQAIALLSEWAEEEDAQVPGTEVSFADLTARS